MKPIFKNIGPLSRFFLSLSLIALLISGCSDKQRIVISNTKVSTISARLRDFVGLGGFTFQYINETDDRATYRVFVGEETAVIPSERKTDYNFSSFAYPRQSSSNIHLRESNASERSIYTPVQTVKTTWSFGIVCTQKGNDVVMITSSTGGFDPGRYIRDWVEYLKSEGLTVTAQN